MTVHSVSLRDQMNLLDFKDMREGDVYLSHYPKWLGVVSGYYPFTVTTISEESMHVIFRYWVRRGAIKGDEPAIFFQNPRTKVWQHYGATTLSVPVPIKVGKLEGRRR